MRQPRSDPRTAAESLRVADLDQFEEEVVFSEWRALRRRATRSLARTRQLLEVLGCDPAAAPHRTLGVVGSKGKGTAAAYSSAALAGSGLRVGTVMSPGVVSNADRIRIDGVALDDETRRWALEQVQRGREQLPEATAESGYLAPTGLFIVMAMLVFAETGVQAVVAEAGIGGASDDLSHWPLDGVAVTGIFGEHLDLLGPEVADVARDKTAVITDETEFCLSFPQDPVPAAVLRARCEATGTSLLAPSPRAEGLVGHLPTGLQRTNAAVGVAAGLALADRLPGAASAGAQRHDEEKSRSLLPGGDGEGEERNILRDAPPQVSQRLSRAVASVTYPGRMSVHTTPGGRRCVVDSAVSEAGLAAALAFAESRLPKVDLVLVCLPPSKDLTGFIRGLRDFAGRRIFVELPEAYTGMPDRSDWPWEWADQEALPGLLEAGDSLAVGTVLYTSHVLGLLGAEAQRLFAR